MLKRIVVVVGLKKASRVIFEGDILAINKDNGQLVIQQNAKKGIKPMVLGVFNHWRYWKKTEIKGTTKKKMMLTYGDLDTMMVVNKAGLVVAKLFILPNGNLAEDSWIHHEGWGKDIEPECKPNKDAEKDDKFIKKWEQKNARTEATLVVEIWEKPDGRRYRKTHKK